MVVTIILYRTAKRLVSSSAMQLGDSLFQRCIYLGNYHDVRSILLNLAPCHFPFFPNFGLGIRYDFPHSRHLTVALAILYSPANNVR